MLKINKVRKPQAPLFSLLDYLWSGFATLGICAGFVALWQLGSVAFGEFMLPNPLDVFKLAAELLRQFTFNQLDISLKRALIGVITSLILGLTFGMIAGSFKTVMAVLKPMITVLLAMPPIIWIVMALFWFGFGDVSVLFTIIIIITPLTFASAAIAVSSLDPQAIELFNVYKLNLYKKIRYLYLPHLTPYIISSVNIAVATGARVVIMAELLGASDGIGSRIADARAMLETTTVMAYVCLVILFVALFEYFITKPLEILFMPWRR
ncbi:ABC transporter permease [Aggregatibacter kilianii]|uniref:ABC transporter permease n=1 Tax=Aggregatibacter kilianii TaxID=2025884 RepID=UPI000D65C1AB|nr:ABC transporter permease subunit [Aggregatibacter kilianii]